MKTATEVGKRVHRGNFKIEFPTPFFRRCRELAIIRGDLKMFNRVQDQGGVRRPTAGVLIVRRGLAASAQRGY